jgi:hypothetical protein
MTTSFLQRATMGALMLATCGRVHAQSSVPPELPPMSAPATAPAPSPSPSPALTPAPAKAPAPSAYKPAGQMPPSGTLPRPNEVQGRYKHVLYARYIGDDTAKAVVHLFSRRRVGGILWSVFGGYYLLSAITTPSTTTRTSYVGGYKTTQTVDNSGSKVVSGVIGVAFGAIGLGKLTRFSHQRLYEVMLAHEQNQPYPPEVLWKLRQKDFQR